MSSMAQFWSPDKILTQFEQHGLDAVDYRHLIKYTSPN